MTGVGGKDVYASKLIKIEFAGSVQRSLCMRSGSRDIRAMLPKESSNSSKLQLAQCSTSIERRCAIVLKEDLNKSQSDNNSSSTFLPGHYDVQLRQMREPTFCAFFLRIKLSSVVVAVPWHGITSFCSTFALNIPRPDKWHLVRIVLATCVNLRVVDWSTTRGNNLPSQNQSESIWINLNQPLPSAQISRLSFHLFVSRTKYKKVGSSIVVVLCFLPQHTAAICGWTDRDFSPHRACIAQLSGDQPRSQPWHLTELSAANKMCTRAHCTMLTILEPNLRSVWATRWHLAEPRTAVANVSA